MVEFSPNWLFYAPNLALSSFVHLTLKSTYKLYLLTIFLLKFCRYIVTNENICKKYLLDHKVSLIVDFLKN